MLFRLVRREMGKKNQANDEKQFSLVVYLIIELNIMNCIVLQLFSRLISPRDASASPQGRPRSLIVQQSHLLLGHISAVGKLVFRD